MAQSIRKLDQAVVNRIAAGEVVHRPASALKEMMENSVDAGSTDIRVTVKSGGQKLLQISDNGSGIKKADLDIVCERFTTSKLRKFEDLKTIQTYGFRGEALASITHVARLSIISKTADSKIGFRAHYSDGKLVPATRSAKSSAPRPCAATTGTTIKVEDLFYNCPTRRKTLGTPSQEYKRILDVVSKFAIHFGSKEHKGGVSFSCKNHGASTGLHTLAHATRRENIRQIYGHQLERELLPLSFVSSALNADATIKDVADTNNEGHAMNKDVADSNDTNNEKTLENKGLLTVDGFISNANYSRKKFEFILFINDRLVRSSRIRKVIEAVYQNYLPSNAHPFCYLSIHLPSEMVDVNVHPTKSEVLFLEEDVVLEEIHKHFEETLKGANASRTFYTQSLLNKDAMRQNEFRNSSDNSETNSEGKNEININASSNNIVEKKQKSKRNKGKQIRRGTPLLSLSSLAHKGNNNDSISNIKATCIGPCDCCDPKDKYRVSDIAAAAASQSNSNASQNQYKKKRKARDDSKMVRIDSSLRKINTFFAENSVPSQSQFQDEKDTQQSQVQSRKGGEGKDNMNVGNESMDSLDLLALRRRQRKKLKRWEKQKQLLQNESNSGKSPSKKRAKVQLMSVSELLDEISRSGHKQLTRIFRGCVYVGVLNSVKSVMQYNTKLFLVDNEEVLQELFYQETIRSFADMQKIQLNPPLDIKICLQLALDSSESPWDSEKDRPKNEIVESGSILLQEKAEMLNEYFAIDINEKGKLVGIPEIIAGHAPQIDRLPKFLLNLVTECDYQAERPCFADVATALADLYSVLPLPESKDAKTIDEFEEIRKMLEQVLWPVVRSSLVPPREWSSDSVVVEIACLKDLYKIFERC
eukprot:g5511.t1